MEPFLEKCGKCNLTFTHEELKLHKKTHATEASFPCDVCPSKFLQVTKLLQHIDSTEHIGLNCGICHTQTKTEAEMLNHLDNCHRTPGRPFNCQLCDTTFRSNRELGLHILKHSDNHPFICTICQKGFKWKQVLKMHMLTHSSDEPHKCPTCGFTTKHKSTLKTHLNRHMDRKFSCPQCKFTTAREQNLREHMENHNREDFYTCPTCQEKFTQKKNLTRHLLRHNTKLPKLSCNECSFTTLRKDKLTAHMHMKHQHTKEARIANDVQPLDMRISTSEHLKVAVTVAAEAEENPEVSLPISDWAAVEKEEPVFVGSPPPPPGFPSFSTGIKILTPSNGDFVNPPNIMVMQSSPIALPFMNAKSPYLPTLHSPYSLSCNQCNFTTLRINKLTAHMHMKHPHMKEERRSKQESQSQNKDSSEAEIEVVTMHCNRLEDQAHSGRHLTTAIFTHQPPPLDLSLRPNEPLRLRSEAHPARERPYYSTEQHKPLPWTLP